MDVNETIDDASEIKLYVHFTRSSEGAIQISSITHVVIPLIFKIQISLFLDDFEVHLEVHFEISKVPYLPFLINIFIKCHLVSDRKQCVINTNKQQTPEF